MPSPALTSARHAARTTTVLFAFAAALAASACSDEPPTGPVAISYGRDTCDLCRMIISDPRFAAQIRGGPGHKAFKFDDIGDALIYFERQPWKNDADVEFWVMDVETGKTWLDARKAHYMPGMQSPMAHGYGAYPVARPRTLDFETMRAAAAKRAADVYCLPEQKNQPEKSNQSVWRHE